MVANLGLKLAVVGGFVGVLTFHQEHVPSLAEAAESPAVSRPSPPPVRPAPASPDGVASAFAAEVTRLSVEADSVDDLWQAYKTECGVRVARPYDFGREWFSVWDGAAEATIDAPVCNALLGRLRQSSDRLRRELLHARATAQEAILDEGTEVGMLRWHALQWP